jgi:hypothetical protein
VQAGSKIVRGFSGSAAIVADCVVAGDGDIPIAVVVRLEMNNSLPLALDVLRRSSQIFTEAYASG